ncbi:MAG: hypothetical protein LC114_13925 [Bryobacterales bacterium]|nr:hypothetical protein [Bryobacterales bacterium]
MGTKKLEVALDELLKDYRDPAEITGPDGLLKQLTKRFLERAMAAELTHHVGYEKHRLRRGQGASVRVPGRRPERGWRQDQQPERNESGVDEGGTLASWRSRSRDGPYGELLPENPAEARERFTGFDNKAQSGYAQGMTTRKIQGISKSSTGWR